VTVSTPEETFHTYSIDWTSERIEWLLDDEVVRTLEYADALGGANYPQTPMRIRIGIWAGGDPDNSEGTIEWAGGETDYTAGPFSMYVESVDIINYNPASSYKYTDKTGAYTSIKASNATMSTNLSTSNSSSIVASSKSSSSSRASSSSVELSSTATSTSATASSASVVSAASASYNRSAFAIAMVSMIVGMVQF
jgi:beta-glucanase (GH16 family)